MKSNRSKPLPLSGRFAPYTLLPFQHMQHLTPNAQQMMTSRIAAEANGSTPLPVSSLPKKEKVYLTALRIFADWLQSKYEDDFPLDQDWPLSPIPLANQHVFDFRASWLSQEKSKSTELTYLSAIMSYLNSLDDQGHLPPEINLSRLDRGLKKERSRAAQGADQVVSEKSAFRQRHIPHLVHYFKEMRPPAENNIYNNRLSILRNKAFIFTLFSTAARLSEVLSLERIQVTDNTSDTVIITGKGGKPRTIILLPYAREAIDTYLRERTDTNKFLFVSHSRRSTSKKMVTASKLSQNAAHEIVTNAFRAVNRDTEDDRIITAHDFRHYRATMLLNKGVPLTHIQELLGHVSISTTRDVYTSVTAVIDPTEIAAWVKNNDNWNKL